MKNMTAFAMTFIALLIIAPFWDYTLSINNYLSFIPFALLMIISFIFSKKNELVYSGEETKLLDIMKASFINLMVFTIFSIVYCALVMLLKHIFSKNVFLFLIYLWLLKDIIFITPGEKILRIETKKEVFIDYLLIMISNLYYILPLFGVFLSDEIKRSQQFMVIFVCVFIFYIINIFYRFFISHNINLLEKILNIKKSKVNEKKS